MWQVNSQCNPFFSYTLLAFILLLVRIKHTKYSQDLNIAKYLINNKGKVLNVSEMKTVSTHFALISKMALIYDYQP